MPRPIAYGYFLWHPPIAQLFWHTSHFSQRRVPFYLHKAIITLSYVLANFMSNKQNTTV